VLLKLVLFLGYLSTPEVKQIIMMSFKQSKVKKHSMALYLKSETDSYYFILAIIWNSITKEYPNNYASAIRHNIIWPV